MVNDSIADMLTRMRNALVMKYNNVEVIGTKMNLGIAEILKREGFIEDFEYQKNTNGDKLNITLKYGEKKERVITGLKRISKSGLRVYVKADNVPRVLNGLGIAILSTSKGLMTDKEARENNLGGEVLAYIW
jgi:small subunit ribosomal protein S8